VQAGSAYQADEASIVRNDGREPAIALQGIVSYNPVVETAPSGVTTELLARHVTDSLAGGSTYVQLDRVSLAPGETMVDPAPREAGVVRSGPTVTLAAVESGTVTLSGSGGKNDAAVTGGAVEAEAGVVTGSGGANVEAEPIAGTAGEPSGFRAGGSGVVSGKTTDEVGGGVGSGGANTAGGAGSVGGDAQTADAEPMAGASGGGGDANVVEPKGESGGEASAFSGEGSAIMVTGTAGGISVTPDGSATVSQIVPASASGVVESSGTTEIRNTGTGPAVAAIFSLVPGFSEATDGAAPESGVGVGGE
jgi:hypothetical protein